MNTTTARGFDHAYRCLKDRSYRAKASKSGKVAEETTQSQKAIAIRQLELWPPGSLN